MFDKINVLNSKETIIKIFLCHSTLYKYLLLLGFIAISNPGSLHADDSTQGDSSAIARSVTEVRPYPTSLWLGAQLIPSPELIFRKDGGSRFGMRWQVTPLLYSFGMNKRLSPWRYFIAEPIVRQNGSIELFFTPEWMRLTDYFSTNWLFRTGLRLYFPLYRYGEYLSGSLSTSYYNYNGQQGVSYEGGIYIFFGILGLQATYSPDMTEAPWILTLRLRYF